MNSKNIFQAETHWSLRIDFCQFPFTIEEKCLVMLYWCIGVLVYWCIGVLVYWCIAVLVYWCIGVLLYWCIGALLYWCIGVLVYCCIGVLLYCCIAALLYCCIAVLLHCTNFTAVHHYVSRHEWTALESVNDTVWELTSNINKSHINADSSDQSITLCKLLDQHLSWLFVAILLLS